MALEMSLHTLLELTHTDKAAAINFAKKFVIPYDPKALNLAEVKKGYVIGSPRYYVLEHFDSLPETWGHLSEDFEFSFDKSAAIITFLERKYSFPSSIRDVMIAGQPNQDLVSVVLGKTPEGVTSMMMPIPPQFGTAAFIYVESGFRQPAVVTYLDGRLPISENKPIMLTYWKPPFPEQGSGKLRDRTLSESLLVLVPREFEKYTRAQGIKQRPA